MLNAGLRLGGDVQSPQLFGQLQLSALDIDGNFMPFEMQPSQLTMNFSGTRSTLAGIVRTQQGQINLNGNADWSQIDNWRARVTAKGSRVRITVPPMVRPDVSPDVVFDATPSLFTLDGRVDVPWARIVVHDLPESAVGVSSDVVMLNNDLQPETPQTASIPINSNLTVHVGNNVRIDAFGLKARLTGDLKVAQDKQGLGLNGQINIPDGRFRAYGGTCLSVKASCCSPARRISRCSISKRSVTLTPPKTMLLRACASQAQLMNPKRKSSPIRRCRRLKRFLICCVGRGWTAIRVIAQR